MPDRGPPEPMPDLTARDPDEQAGRWDLVGHLQNLLEPVMIALGLAFLVLLVIDFSDITRSPAQRLWLDWALTAIWVVFVVDFVLRLAIAPAKSAFLRAN